MINIWSHLKNFFAPLLCWAGYGPAADPKLPAAGASLQDPLMASGGCHYEILATPLLPVSPLSKVEAISLSALHKVTASEFAGLSSHYPSNAERQAGKLQIPTFKSFGLTLN